MNERIARFLADNSPETPCLVVDLDVIAEAYERCAGTCRWRAFTTRSRPTRRPKSWRCSRARAPNFDVASRGEIELCLDNGATAERLSFGNTIKKEHDIAFAYGAGRAALRLRQRGTSSRSWRASAPGARVFCRILVDCDGAEWPLSRKFGCTPEMAVDLLRRAREIGLDPYGVSFHVGSQQTDLGQWDGAVGAAARMFSLLAEADIDLRMVNIGGGFPAHYTRRGAGGRALCRGGDGGGDPAFRQPPARDHRRARPLAGRRCRGDPERGRADLRKGRRRRAALGLSRCRQVQRPRRDHGREHQIPDRDPRPRRADAVR